MTEPNGLLEPGSTATLLCDIFPGEVTPRPAGVPAGVKLRVLVTETTLTCAWLAGRVGLEPIIGRVDLALDPDWSSSVNFQGGTFGPYTVSRGAGCSCGSAGLKVWQPFPDVQLVSGVRFTETVSGPVNYARP